MRYHTCYGINEGPRIFDMALKDIVGLMLKVKARAIAFEAANARHEHEWHVWEDVKLPDGKIIIHRVITQFISVESQRLLKKCQSSLKKYACPLPSCR